MRRPHSSIIFMFIPCVHATTLLKFFWVQVRHLLGTFQCCKDGAGGDVVIWKQPLLDLHTEERKQ